MNENGLRSASLLFWLVVLLAAGIIFIGIRFLAAPLTAAAAFGVPAGPTSPMAYLWAKGTRDIVSGLLLLALLGMRVGRRVLAVFILVAALIAVGDFVNVYLNMGYVSALGVHAGTAAFMIILAALLWRHGGS
jgi:hypothetical protein